MAALRAADLILGGGVALAEDGSIEGDREVRDAGMGLGQQPLESGDPLDQIAGGDVFIDDVVGYQGQQRIWPGKVGPTGRPLLEEFG
jgi:hypothetical protein